MLKSYKITFLSILTTITLLAGNLGSALALPPGLMAGVAATMIVGPDASPEATIVAKIGEDGVCIYDLGGGGNFEFVDNPDNGEIIKFKYKPGKGTPGVRNGVRFKGKAGTEVKCTVKWKQ